MRAPLPANVQTVISQWGEMASHWGLNRTEAQIHALLFLSPEPLDAQEISETLSVARSHVSNSLKELQRWGIVRLVPVLGERREHFESMKDVWEIFRAVANEQKRREIDPWTGILRQSVATLREGGKAAEYPRQKLAEMLEFFETLSAWQEDIKGLSTPALRGFMKMGAKAARLFGAGNK